MNDGVIKDIERVRASPPSGRIRRIAAVRRPAIAFVVAEAVVLADVLGITYAFENAHVLAGREDVSPLDFCVNMYVYISLYYVSDMNVVLIRLIKEKIWNLSKRLINLKNVL